MPLDAPWFWKMRKAKAKKDKNKHKVVWTSDIVSKDGTAVHVEAVEFGGVEETGEHNAK